MIQKQFIEISFEDISDAFALQNHVSEVFHEKMLPQMELLFDEFADDRHLIKFNELRIDCPELSRERWEQEWVEETIKGLRKELIAANKISIEKELTKRKIQEEFFFFLKHGYLQWDSRIISMQEFAELEFDSQLVERLKQFIRAEEKAAERLVYNFTEEFIRVAINSLAMSQPLFAKKLNSLTITTPRQKRAIVLANVIKELCSEESSHLTIILEEFANRSKERSESAQKREKRKEESESIYVGNAGLIIFHPYLQQLFEAVDLMSGKSWKDRSARYTAVNILQYLVNASDEAPEFDLPLNKILCGFFPDEVLEEQEPLSIQIKNECESLIAVVIQHWAALKNTSVVAFRETFLQRNGKLSRVDNGWLLQVEQKAVDVLLTRLPWGIGTIRLPWTDQIIYTEWC